jgi:hypothetical protein
MANRKHFVLIQTKYIPVKDWYRSNPQHFNHITRIPTSEEIGAVLVNLGFTRTETATQVLYV